MRPTIHTIEPRKRPTHKAIAEDRARWLEPNREIQTPYTRADDLRAFRNAVSKLGKAELKKFSVVTKRDGSVWLQRHES